ncbi:MAG: signal peptidase I [Clostridia bacterium]|nr:signal peptidase I [Clostridia bacterium]
MKVKKILSAVAAVFGTLIFLIGLAVFISVLKTEANQVPDVMGFSVMKIQTGSMEPEYKTGSVIVTKKVPADKLNIGDVISFYSTGGQIADMVNTHRIEEIYYLKGGERQFVTKGDANKTIDEYPVYESRIIGKVVLNLGVMSGSVIGFLQNPNIILFLIVIPLVVITFLEAVNLINVIINKNDDSTEEEQADEPKSKRKRKAKNSD